MRGLMAAALVAALLAVCALPAGVAWGDGDPGSDVLVYQDLFAGPDAGMSVVQQAHSAICCRRRLMPGCRFGWR